MKKETGLMLSGKHSHGGVSAGGEHGAGMRRSSSQSMAIVKIWLIEITNVVMGNLYIFIGCRFGSWVEKVMQFHSTIEILKKSQHALLPRKYFLQVYTLFDAFLKFNDESIILGR